MNGLLCSSPSSFSLSFSLPFSVDPVQDTHRRFSEIHGFVKRPADKTTNNSQLSFPSLPLRLPIYPPALSLWNSWRRTRGGGLVVVQVTAAGACFFFQKGSAEGGRTERLDGWMAGWLAGCWLHELAPSSYLKFNEVHVRRRLWRSSHRLEWTPRTVQCSIDSRTGEIHIHIHIYIYFSIGCFGYI